MTNQASFQNVTREQRLAACMKSAEIRGARARLKRAIRGGQLHVVEVLADPPEYALKMKVRDLLMAQPWRGEAKTQMILRSARVSYGKTIGGLSERQRGVLIAAVSSQRLVRRPA